ncbi:SPOR domain-containing protein [uncultured Fibrobacter sp.]|uniref:SPOR domain-containing protein n=1 Tax=uncultured Fibrobacter sp. TaxID=261512 RepID=UPI00262461BC|nr:SPOR domain-containing protein [uncultured Fibrobacter sp.]
MKMKFWNVRGIAAALFFAASAFAQSMADAQKAYVAGKWQEAASAYEAACPKEPDSVRTECYLWNVLALSQTGNAQSFKIAGRRLDSLIQATNPQRAIYADLMMTSAQFRMYLGKYEKAAEDLIQAIETSHPQHAVVLKKVCLAIKSKVKTETLEERCNQLNNPDSLAAMQARLKAPQAAGQPNAQPADQVAATTEVPQPAVVDSVPKPLPPPQPKVEENAVQPYWTLQLGAFGTKSNADLLVTNLKKQKIACTIAEQPRGERMLYLVQTGHFESREQAIDFAANKLAPLKIEFQPLLKK